MTSRNISASIQPMARFAIFAGLFARPHERDLRVITELVINHTSAIRTGSAATPPSSSSRSDGFISFSLPLVLVAAVCGLSANQFSGTELRYISRG